MPGGHQDSQSDPRKSSLFDLGRSSIATPIVQDASPSNHASNVTIITVEWAYSGEIWSPILCARELEAGFLHRDQRALHDGHRGRKPGMKAQSPPFGRLIKALDNFIVDVAAWNLPETVALLRIVRIDLISRANGISSKDLDTLLAALEFEQGITDHLGRTEPKKRSRKAEKLASHS